MFVEMKELLNAYPHETWSSQTSTVTPQKSPRDPAHLKTTTLRFYVATPPYY